MSGERDFEIVHGTALALGEKAVLIRGASGAGKSDLALRCIALPALAHISNRAELVSDDQVRLRNVEGAIEVSPPETIAGLLEVRGLGVLTVPYRAQARLALVVDLVAAVEVPRYPLDATSVEYLSVRLPLLRLTAFESSCPIKVILALHAA
jgi:serine kinase of HPr protein (carbohydrate metabolism regulator)